MNIRKNWKNCGINELQAGDILMFRPNMKILMSQVGIMIYQSFFHRQGGHFDTVHVAVCTGRNAEGAAMIAHAAIVPKVPNDYFHEPVQDMLTREGGDRAFIVYRPHNKAFAEMIGNIAVTEKRSLSWSMASAMTSVLPSVNFNYANDSEDSIATNTFCSRFAIEVMKRAARKVEGVDVNICSRSTPKSLESYLEKDTAFEKFCYLGQNPFQRFDTEIQNQLNRLERQKHTAVQEKFHKSFTAYQKAIDYIRLNAIENETDKIQILLQYVLPEFAKHTQWNVTPTSYKKVTKLARSMGIFKKNITMSNTNEIITNAVRLG
jgi:hypothetical protein